MTEENQGLLGLGTEPVSTPQVEVSTANMTDELLAQVAAAPTVEGSMHLPAAQHPRLETSHIVDAGDLEEAIGLSLGAASMMWSEPSPGVFQSEGALQIANALRHRINMNTQAVLIDFLTWYTQAGAPKGEPIEAIVQKYLDE